MDFIRIHELGIWHGLSRGKSKSLPELSKWQAAVAVIEVGYAIAISTDMADLSGAISPLRTIRKPSHTLSLSSDMKRMPRTLTSTCKLDFYLNLMLLLGSGVPTANLHLDYMVPGHVGITR